MVYQIFFTIIIVALGFLFCREWKRAADAEECWSDMGKKYRELIRDQSMSSEQWREWLPIFEVADEWYAKTHPFQKDFLRHAEAVKDEIDDLPCRGVGSR